MEIRPVGTVLIQGGENGQRDTTLFASKRTWLKHCAHDYLKTTAPICRDPPYKLHGRRQIDLFHGVYSIPVPLLNALRKNLDFGDNEGQTWSCSWRLGRHGGAQTPFCLSLNYLLSCTLPFSITSTVTANDQCSKWLQINSFYVFR